MALGVDERSVGLFLEVKADRLKSDLCPSGLFRDPDRSRDDCGGGGKAGVA